MNQPLRVEATEGNAVRFHENDLPEDQKELLKANSPTPDEILENLDALRDEAVNAAQVSGAEVVEEDATLPPPKEDTKDPPKLPDVSPPQVSPKRSARRAAVGAPFDPRNRVDVSQTSDLDKELAEMEEEANQETPQEQVGMDMRSQILELLRNTPGAPTEQQIEGLKQKYGRDAVHVFAFGEGDVYIYTHLKRGQWKKIQEVAAKAQAIDNKELEDKLREKVLQHCILWPQLPVEFFYNSRAGVVDTLYEVILVNSYFLSPQQAMLLSVVL